MFCIYTQKFKKIKIIINLKQLSTKNLKTILKLEKCIGLITKPMHGKKKDLVLLYNNLIIF